MSELNPLHTSLAALRWYDTILRELEAAGPNATLTQVEELTMAREHADKAYKAYKKWVASNNNKNRTDTL